MNLFQRSVEDRLQNWGDTISGKPNTNELDAKFIDSIVMRIKNDRLRMALLFKFAHGDGPQKFKRFSIEESLSDAIKVVDYFCHLDASERQIIGYLEDGMEDSIIAQTTGKPLKDVQILRAMTQ